MIVRRVSEADFESAKHILKSLGTVRNESEAVERMTASRLDTMARIKTKSTEYNRLTDILAKTASVDSLIFVENRLSYVTSELDGLKNMLRSYTAMPTLTIELLANQQQRAEQTGAVQMHVAKQSVWQRAADSFNVSAQLSLMTLASFVFPIFAAVLILAILFFVAKLILKFKSKG